jgi:hypothetical protein
LSQFEKMFQGAYYDWAYTMLEMWHGIHKKHIPEE